MHKQLMGVINLTPDSFSDGSQFNQVETFKARFEKIKSWADIIDLGAESTAPFNDKVGLDAEKERFEQIFFPLMDELADPQLTLSIDTYKLEVFTFVYERIRKNWPYTKVIFNDVSGKLDESLIEYLKSNPEVKYVFSHNLCPNRSDTSDHMMFCDSSPKEDFYHHFIEYFLAGINKLRNHQIDFCIDPCFGFSKTREQNHFLLARFKSFLLQIPFDIDVLIGLSRKSFLRFPSDLDIKQPANLAQVEQVHSIVLSKLFTSNFKRNFIIRTHEPEPVWAANSSVELFEL